MTISLAPVETVRRRPSLANPCTRVCRWRRRGRAAADRAREPQRGCAVERATVSQENSVMKIPAMLLAAAALAAIPLSSADAKGCLKGAAAGGVAGHYAGHHGLLGAAAGCLYGRHHAKQQARQQQQQQGQPHAGQEKM